MDELCQRLGIEPEFLRSDRGEQLGAGLERRVVELLAGMVETEMLGILGLEKGALVMVEPPGQLRGAGIFEIHDGVFVAIEDAVFEELGGLVHHACIEEFGVAADAFAVKAREDCGGGGSVEAFVVKADADLQFPLPRAGREWKILPLMESQ